MPNVDIKLIELNVIPLIESIRSSKNSNDKPIIFVEQPECHDDYIEENIYEKNNILKKEIQNALKIGYKRIYLIGCDLNYIEQIKESNKKINNKNQEFLQMEKTPEKNPNYWFDDYQQKGDIYNIPNGKEMHLPGWEAIKKYTDFYNIEIFNCSDISEIPYFKFYDIKKIYN